MKQSTERTTIDASHMSQPSHDDEDGVPLQHPTREEPELLNMSPQQLEELLRETDGDFHSSHTELGVLASVDGMKYAGLDENGKITAICAYEEDSLEIPYCSDARIRSVVSLAPGGGDRLTKWLFDGGMDVDFVWGVVERGSTANIGMYLSRHATQVPLELFDTKVDFGRDLVFYWKPLNANETDRRKFLEALTKKFG